MPPVPEHGHGPVLCKYGFHACVHPAVPFLDNVFYYGYRREQGDVLLEVQLHGEVVTDGIKSVALACTPLRAISDEEYTELVKGSACLESPEERVCLKDGLLHSPDASTPACVVKYAGILLWCKWYRDGVVHQDDDKPATVLVDTVSGMAVTKKWFKDGCLHRDNDNPAEINGDGCAWYCHGKLHREKLLPARITKEGKAAWYKHGEWERWECAVDPARKREFEAIVEAELLAAPAGLDLRM